MIIHACTMKNALGRTYASINTDTYIDMDIHEEGCISGSPARSLSLYIHTNKKSSSEGPYIQLLGN